MVYQEVSIPPFNLSKLDVLKERWPEICSVLIKARGLRRLSYGWTDSETSPLLVMLEWVDFSSFHDFVFKSPEFQESLSKNIELFSAPSLPSILESSLTGNLDEPAVGNTVPTVVLITAVDGVSSSIVKAEWERCVSEIVEDSKVNTNLNHGLNIPYSTYGIGAGFVSPEEIIKRKYVGIITASASAAALAKAQALKQILEKSGQTEIYPP